MRGEHAGVDDVDDGSGTAVAAIRLAVQLRRELVEPVEMPQNVVRKRIGAAEKNLDRGAGRGGERAGLTVRRRELRGELSGKENSRNNPESRGHVLNIIYNMLPKLTRLHFGRARHLALEVVGDLFLLNRLRDAALDGVGGFEPLQVAQHHHAGEDQ
jgi:hypothetical protein